MVGDPPHDEPYGRVGVPVSFVWHAPQGISVSYGLSLEATDGTEPERPGGTENRPPAAHPRGRKGDTISETLGDKGDAGAAHVVTDEREVAVDVRMCGHFQPIDGHYHWYGRVCASAAVDDLVQSGATVLLRTPHGEARGRLSDQDPWGRYRVSGTSRPPFPLT